MSSNVYWSSCKVPAIRVRFYYKLISLDRYLKNTQISNLMKICPVETDLFHPDGQMDKRTEGRTGKHNEANRSLKKYALITS
jgi:hypothetical protein